MLIFIFCVSLAWARQMTIVYEDVELSLYKKPAFLGRKEVPVEESDKFKFQETRWLDARFPNTKTIIEDKGNNQKFYYIIRNNIYYGEYLNRILNDQGDFHHDETVYLPREEKRRLIMEGKKPTDLKYEQTKINFKWKGDKIVEIKRISRECKYDQDGQLVALTDWSEHKLNE